MFKRREKEVSLPGVVKYTRFVARVKRTLIALLVLISAALIIWPLVTPARKHMKLTFTTVTSDELGMTQMTNPQFQGVDSENQPYHVLADIAVQENKETVRLSKVRGKITLKNGGWVKIVSDNGLITLNSRELKLYGNVVLESHEGFVMKTESALLYLKEKKASGDVPVAVEGPTGKLFATGFLLDGNQNTLNFTGPVKMIIYPESAPGRAEVKGTE